MLGALAAAVLWLDMDQGRAVTVSFLTLAFSQLWHVFNMRDRGSGFIRNEITRNQWIWGALALCILLLLIAVYVPGLAKVMSVTKPGTKGWVLIIGMSLIPWVTGQVVKEVDGIHIAG